MKRVVLVVLAWMSLAQLTWAQTSQFYINDGIVTTPPVIDATNFVNNGQFYATNAFITTPYNTYNTLNFSNRNLMRAGVGFKFETIPSGSGVAKMAANFVNAASVNPTNSLIHGGQRVTVLATNIINRGRLNVGVDGLLSLRGRTVDLSRGTLRVDGFDTNTFFSQIGVFNDYWGVGTNFGGGSFQQAIFSSPFHVTTSLVAGVYTFGFQQLFLTNGPPQGLITNRFSSASFQPADATGTNFNMTIVYLANSNNLTVPAEIRFFGTRPEIEWRAVTTNKISGLVTTNSLYLSDSFGFNTNLSVVPVFSTSPLQPKATYRPFNYSITRSNPFFTFGDTGVDFDPALVNFGSGSYAAWGAKIAPTSEQVFTNIPGAGPTNMPGRIEIIAEHTLDMAGARIDGLNYLRLMATNHFIGSSNANVIAPISDINLCSTNGSLVISNVLSPVVPRIVGDIFCWSARATNGTTFTAPNGLPAQVRYHILMVDSRLFPDVQPVIQDLTLRSKGAPGGINSVTVGDVLNVQRDFLIEAEQLTITRHVVTNTVVIPNPPNPPSVIETVVTNSMGEINFGSDMIVWSTSLPRLQYLTNHGRIAAGNAAYFGGARRSPFFNVPFDEAYRTFINSGLISAHGLLIWADVFQNSGNISSGTGPLTLQAGSVVMTNDVAPVVFSAPNGDLTITASSMVASNLIMEAGRKLSLSVTGLLTDGGFAASNTWRCGDGFDLLVKPAAGDLLGTIVTNVAFDLTDVINTWAGEDRGANSSGFSDNAALNRLVLDGGFFSRFTFRGATGANALYVDFLELQNNATNFASAIQIDPGMTVYFANANISPDKLNSHPSGRLVWVQGFAGPNSTTVVPLRSGGSLTINKALAESSSIDSDGDGVPNKFDAFPFDGAVVNASLAGSIPAPQTLLSWSAASNTVYIVECSTNLTSWQFVTNVTSGSSAGVITIQYPVSPSGRCYYRVRYSP